MLGETVLMLLTLAALVEYFPDKTTYWRGAITEFKKGVLAISLNLFQSVSKELLKIEVFVKSCLTYICIQLPKLSFKNLKCKLALFVFT